MKNLSFLFLLALFAQIINAATIYVSPTGSNGNDGLSSSTPFQTIDYAVSYTVNNGGPQNNNVILLDGTWSNITISNNSACANWTSNLVIEGENTDVLITSLYIECPHITVRGIKASTIVSNRSPGDYSRVEDVESVGYTKWSITASNITWLRCKATDYFDTPEDVVRIAAVGNLPENVPENILIEDCCFRGSYTSEGNHIDVIQTLGVSNLTFRNCKIYNAPTGLFMPTYIGVPIRDILFEGCYLADGRLYGATDMINATFRDNIMNCYFNYARPQGIDEWTGNTISSFANNQYVTVEIPDVFENNIIRSTAQTLPPSNIIDPNLVITEPECQALSIANKFYCDPVNGSMANSGTSPSTPWADLETVVSQIAFDDGATIYLMSGNHGNPIITENNTANVTITKYNTDNPVIGSIIFNGADYWTLKDVKVSANGIAFPNPNVPLEHPVYPLVENSLVQIINSSNNIIIEDCNIGSIDNSSVWTVADDWNYKAWNGIIVSGGQNIDLTGNYIKNVNFGILASGGAGVIMDNNTIENFCGDGIRPDCNNAVVQYNTVKNAYNTNGNHDDLLQIYTGGNVTGVIIRGNKFFNYTDPNQPFKGSAQGIGNFDGWYIDFVIENNLIVTDHWHGLTLLGAQNCKVVNNTVVDPNDASPGPCWLQIGNHKNGSASTGNIVKNNLVTDLAANGVGTVSNNIEITWAQYSTYFNDYANFDFSLKASPAVDAGTAVDAPSVDIEGVSRPQGNGVDVGAYEFVGIAFPVTGVSVSPTSLTLVEDQSSDLTETVEPASASNKNVTWSSSNTAIATVDANGLVTGVAPGTCTITVTTNDGGFTANCSVTVNSYGVNLALNKPITVSAYQDDANGTYPGTNLVDGNVSDDARWSASGLSQWAEIDLGTNYDLTEIRLYPYQNRAYQYIIESKPDGGSYSTIVDRSANTESADALIDNVTGSARYVKITTSGLSGSTSTWVSLAELKVYATSGSVPVTGVSISTSTLSLEAGQTSDLDETVSPANATDKSVTWSSNNTSVATVNANGLVTAVTAGNATITVTTTDGGFTATCNVTVNASGGGTPTNVALNKPVTTDSEYNASYPGAYAVDGNNTDNASRWLSANTSDPHWIEIDLQGTYIISQVNFWTGYNGYNYPLSNYQIQYWTGSTWADAVNVTGNSNAIVSHAIADISADKIRLYSTSSGTNIVRLYEIEVWGATSVTTIPVTGVSVSPSSLSLNVSQTFDLTETVSPVDATDQSVTWSSNNTSIATVDANGLVTAAGAGSATITVTTNDGGFTANCAVTVTVPVTGVTLSASSLNLDAGQTADLDETVSPANATNKSVSWSSNNTSVATIDANGLVTAVGAGNATITVTTNDGGFTANCAVTVTVPVTGVTLSSTSITLEEGQTDDLDETVSPANATDKSVTWSSNNTSVAMVDASGLVTAIAEGSAIITVTTVDGGFTATCDVTVNVAATNLALNQPITVSAYQDDSFGYKPGENLVDGDVSDDARWSASGFPQWAEIDLGANYDLSQIDLYPYQDRAYQYIVEAKLNGGSYTTIVDKSSNTESADLLVSPVSITARYVKITVSGLYGSSSSWVSLAELQVWGTIPATIPVTDVTLSSSSLSLEERQTADLDETVSPVDATDKSVTWSSNNTSIATVDANGLVTAVSAGSATITVTTADGGFTANCNVTVTSPQPVTLNPIADSYVRGLSFANSNFGTDNIFYVKYHSYAEYDRQGYLKFDLSGISETVSSAVLRLYVRSSDGSSTHTVKPVSDDSWTETGITYNNKPAAGNAINTFNVSSAGNYVEVDIASAVNAEAGGTLSLQISSNNDRYIGYDSREGANKPELYITFGGQSNASIASNEVSSELENANPTLNIYPNPVGSNNYVNIDLSGYDAKADVIVRIMDVTGKLAYTEQLSGYTTRQLNVSALKKGIYFISSTNGTRTEQTKLIIK